MNTSKRIQLDPVKLFGVKQHHSQVASGKITLARAMVGGKISSPHGYTPAAVPTTRA